MTGPTARDCMTIPQPVCDHKQVTFLTTDAAAQGLTKTESIQVKGRLLIPALLALNSKYSLDFLW